MRSALLSAWGSLFILILGAPAVMAENRIIELNSDEYIVDSDSSPTVYPVCENTIPNEIERCSSGNGKFSKKNLQAFTETNWFDELGPVSAREPDSGKIKSIYPSSYVASINVTCGLGSTYNASTDKFQPVVGRAIFPSGQTISKERSIDIFVSCHLKNKEITLVMREMTKRIRQWISDPDRFTEGGEFLSCDLSPNLCATLSESINRLRSKQEEGGLNHAPDFCEIQACYAYDCGSTEQNGIQYLELGASPQAIEHYESAAQNQATEIRKLIQTATGYTKEYDDNGNLKAEGPLANGLKEGSWTLYSKSGKAETTFSKGVETGFRRNYSRLDGDDDESSILYVLRSEGMMKNAQAHGMWSYYEQDGEHTKDIEWVDGIADGRITGYMGEWSKSAASYVSTKKEKRFEGLCKNGKPWSWWTRYDLYDRKMTYLFDSEGRVLTIRYQADIEAGTESGGAHFSYAPDLRSPAFMSYFLKKPERTESIELTLRSESDEFRYDRTRSFSSDGRFEYDLEEPGEFTQPRFIHCDPPFTFKPDEEIDSST